MNRQAEIAEAIANAREIIRDWRREIASPDRDPEIDVPMVKRTCMLLERAAAKLSEIRDKELGIK